MIDTIEKLLNTTAYIIDIFPRQVVRKLDNRYFEVENLFLQQKDIYDKKFIDVLIKLFCYYDLVVWANDNNYTKLSLNQYVALLDNCFNGRIENVNIILLEQDCLIVVDRDNLYVTVYNPSENIKELLAQLSLSQGLFFRAC